MVGGLGLAGSMSCASPQRGVLRVALATLVLPLAVWWNVPYALAGAFCVVDEDGVIHVTNTPADPRYRGLPALSGTTSGSFRFPSRVRDSYDELIQEVSARYRVDPVLVKSMIHAESAFNPAAISLRGAQGLMQLMPQTATGLGVRDSFDPRENIEGGVRHLRYLLDRYPGNVPLAIAAYNAGEGAVNSYRGIPPYPETQRYVERVLAVGGLARTAGGGQAVIYRYRSSDGAVIYSNRPQGSALERPIADAGSR